MFPARVQALYRIPRIPISSLDFPANFFQSFRPMTMMILATEFPYILHRFSSRSRSRGCAEIRSRSPSIALEWEKIVGLWLSNSVGAVNALLCVRVEGQKFRCESKGEKIRGRGLGLSISLNRAIV